MGYHGEFESDDERALVHIPMAMRYRLDQCGIKLTLNQWQALPVALRRRVLELPCDTAIAIEDFRRELAAHVKAPVDEDVALFKVTRPFPWERGTALDEQRQTLSELRCDTISEAAFARPRSVSSRLASTVQEFCGARQAAPGSMAALWEIGQRN